ncbi:hypothetical protein [Pseudomonas fluorescens]|nr:hypothetical protein [Pseudomonas fluorescens]
MIASWLIHRNRHMLCECCEGLSQGIANKGTLVWMGHSIQITHIPVGLSADEQRGYRILLDSGLAWKVDHVDAHGHPWLALQYSAERYETMSPISGSYRLIPCDPVYPVLKHLPTS